MKHLACALLAVILTAQNAAADYVNVWKPTANTCPDILALETMSQRFASVATGQSVHIHGDEARAFERFAEASGYIEGFLTGANIEDWKRGGTGSALQGIGDVYNVWPWLLSWCRQNPKGTIDQAMSHYVETMRGR